MNGENIRRRGNWDDRVVEMTGLLELGMHQDALNKARAVLSREQLSADEFSEAVWAILIAEGDCKAWENPVICKTTMTILEVVTQRTIDGGGYIDLVLQQQERFLVAVEVKVRSPENCPHHREQLKNYRAWLGDMPNKFLFTLVRNKDETFSPETFGANGRHTWRELYDRFRQLLKTDSLSDVEISLIANFCDYLESENIVITYKTKDLQYYAAGMRARKAITGIFAEVASRLENDGFKTRPVEDRKDYWPQLKIQHPDWEKIFGKGENWKISIWFVVPGIWDAKEYSFYPEIELLNTEHKNKWEYIKSKLPQWEDILKGKQFNWKVCQYRDEQRDTPAREILFPPKRIISSNDDGLGGADFPVNEEELVNKLVDWVKRYAEVIKSLEGGH